jgi:hypothetical protein
LTLKDAGDRSDSLLIFDERAGIPFVFQTIKCWEVPLRKWGIKEPYLRILATCSIASVPLILLAIRHWPYRPLTAFWAVWLALCDSLIVLLSWRSWDAFMGTRSSLMDMLQDVRDDELADLEKCYFQVFRRGPQLCVCSLIALITLWVALQLPSSIVERVPVTVVSLLVSGFVAGHAFYFIMNTARLVRKASRISNLRLRWNDPINTPGLVSLSKADQFEAQMGMILFLVVAAPLTYAYVNVHKVDVRVLYLGEMLLPLACIIVIGLVIQSWLADPARRHKAATLEELSASIDSLRAGRTAGSLKDANLALIKEQLEVYELLNNTADSFFRGGVVTQYLTSMAAAAVPFIVAFLLQRG